MEKKYYKITFDVLLEHTNMVGNVYFSNYFSWMGKIREQFILDHDSSVIKLLQLNELSLITLSCNCTFYDELFAGNKVEMRMYLDNLRNNKVKMRIDYYKVQESGEVKLVTIGYHEIGCYVKKFNELEPLPFPPNLQKAFELYL